MDYEAVKDVRIKLTLTEEELRAIHHELGQESVCYELWSMLDEIVLGLDNL